ncbi:MAG: leucine-rich repeat domain-containing protein [Phocaeicola vulgatus]
MLLCFSENLISVNLPLVEKIGKESFRVCDNLSSISLPKLKTSDDEAFVACDKLTKIDMPKLTNLADEIFSGCDLLEKVSFPCVTEIDSKVFYSCDNLKEITLGAPMPITTNIISFDGLNTEGITLYICGANWDEVTKRFHWRGIEWFDVVELK